MFRAIRRTRLSPLIIAVALLATMPANMASLFHDDGDDAICGRAFAIHAHEGHHIGGAIPSSLPDPQHCFICHSPSFFAIQSAAVWGVPTPPAQRLNSSHVRPASTVAAGGRAARAPPLV